MAKEDLFISSRAISAEIGNIVSSRTVRRRLYAANLLERIVRKIPLLRQKSLKARQTFARVHTNWSGPEGEKSGAMSYGSTKLKLICSAMTRIGTAKNFTFVLQKRQTGRGQHNGLGLFFVERCWSCTSNFRFVRFQYMVILENIMLPYASENMPLRWVFQQDNVQKHTSKLCQDWFRDNEYSEHLWGELK